MSGNLGSNWRDRDHDQLGVLGASVLTLAVVYLVLNRAIPDRFVLPIGQSLRLYEIVLVFLVGTWIVWIVTDPHPFPGGILGLTGLAVMVVIGVAPYVHSLTMTTYQANGAERGLFRFFLFSGLFLASFHLAFRLRTGRTLLGWVVGVTTVQALFAVYEFITERPIELFNTIATGIGFVPDPKSIRTDDLDTVFMRLTGEVRAVATAPHPIVLSAIVALGLLIASTWLIVSNSRVQRRWLALATLILIIALPVANSRTAFVILGVAFLPLLVLMIRYIPRILPALLIAFVMMGLAFAISPQTPRLLLNTVANPGDDHNTQVRIERYSRIPELLNERPWVGAGYLTHNPQIQIFDNAYIRELIELGVIGVVLIVLFFLITLVRSWSAVPRARDDELILPIAAVAATIAVLAGGATFDAWTFDQFFPTALIVMGLGVGRATVISKRTESQPANRVNA